MKKIIHIAFIAMFAIGCTKDIVRDTSNSLLINDLDEGETIPMIIENAGRGEGEVYLSAYGYGAEKFRLTLSNIFDTTTINNPAIDHIYFSDGIYFFPVKIENGFIRIGTINERLLKGCFEVTFSDGFHMVGRKKIEGFFTIVF